MRLLIPLLTVLILYVTGPAVALAESPQTLRVLVYNIHHGAGTDGKLDMERIAGVIERAEPDLVALQEVDRGTRRTEGIDQPAVLGEMTGLHAAFGKAIDYQGGDYGQAILSRFPIQDVQVHPLPGSHDGEQRIAVSAKVRPGGDGEAIRFISTHLDHRPDPADRLAQAAEINELFTGDAIPTIAAGDFNAKPDSEVMKNLREHWTDAAAEAGSPEHTFPAPSPRKRIDYVLYRPADHWRVVEARVIEEKVASDHRPLLVVLERTAEEK